MKFLFKKIIVRILTIEARAVLRIYKPKIVAITGSVGKTSTKDAVYAILSANFHTRKSDKSFNSEIGVPLTILGLPTGWNNPLLWLLNIVRGFFLCIPISYKLKSVSFPKWLVLEVGADRPGDIESISKWLKPDAVIVTRFGEVPVHVEFFKSKSELVKEKSFLVGALKDNGILLLNNDDDDVRGMREVKRVSRTITWGVESEADFKASNFEFIYEEKDGRKFPSGIVFKVNYNGNCVPITVNGTLGRQQVYPILAALAFGGSLGFNLIKMSELVASHKTPPGRMHLLEGVKHTTIIDDTYNSSPIALKEALRALREVEIKRSSGTRTKAKKIAVLGDMLELGKYSGQEHEIAGREAKESCDILITIGVRARSMAEGALNIGMDEKNVFQFDTSMEAGKFVEDTMKEGDILLVKGSQGVRMEKIIEEIMAEPEKKELLLVRQEPKWQRK